MKCIVMKKGNIFILPLNVIIRFKKKNPDVC